MRRRGSPSGATSGKATAAATASLSTTGTATCTPSGTAPLDARFRARYKQRTEARFDAPSDWPPPPDQFWRFFREARDREYERHKDRVAAEARARHPLDDAVRANLKSGDFEAWAQESNQIVRESLYPPDLERGRAPSSAYTDRAYDIALRRAALAGYRLADLLRDLLG